MKTPTKLTFARRWHLPALALLFAAVTLLAFAPQPVHAGPSYPFHARFITEFEVVVEPPYWHYTVNGQGRASYMGPTTVVTTDQLISRIDRSATATYTLTSNSAGVLEDTLTLAMNFQETDLPGGIAFTGTYTVTGGTGRFAAVTGNGIVAGSLFFKEGRTSGIGSFALSGGITFGPGD